MGKSAEDEVKRIGSDVASVAGVSHLASPIGKIGGLPGLVAGGFLDPFSISGSGSAAPESPADTQRRPAPNLADERIQEALKLARGRRNAQSGRSGTILTGPRGITGLPEVTPASLTGGV